MQKHSLVYETWYLNKNTKIMGSLVKCTVRSGDNLLQNQKHYCYISFTSHLLSQMCLISVSNENVNKLSVWDYWDPLTNTLSKLHTKGVKALSLLAIYSIYTSQFCSSTIFFSDQRISSISVVEIHNKFIGVRSHWYHHKRHLDFQFKSIEFWAYLE